MHKGAPSLLQLSGKMEDVLLEAVQTRTNCFISPLGSACSFAGQCEVAHQKPRVERQGVCAEDPSRGPCTGTTQVSVQSQRLQQLRLLTSGFELLGQSFPDVERERSKSRSLHEARQHERAFFVLCLLFLSFIKLERQNECRRTAGQDILAMLHRRKCC